MTDENGLIIAGDFAGDLPERLTDVFRTHAEVCAASAPWLDGKLSAPLAEVKHLGFKLRELEAAVHAALHEGRMVHAAIRDSYAAEKAA